MVVRRAACVLVALVLAGSIGCSFIPAYTAAAQFRAASFLPADTWLFSEVTLRPSLTQLAGASRLADAFTKQPGWDAYVQRVSGPAGPQATKLATDVLGLLDGEVAVGAFGSFGSSAQIPQVVAVAHSSDPDGLINLITKTEGITLPPPTKNAQGASVYVLPGNATVATFHGWLVVASSSNVMELTLNRIGGVTTSGGLNDAPHFKALVGRLPADRLALEYIDSGTLLRSVGSGLLMNQPGVPPDTAALLQQIDSQVALSFAAASGGLDIRFEGTTRLPPDLARQSPAVALGDASDAFAHLPEDTLAAYAIGLPPLAPQLDTGVALALQQLASRLELPDLAELDLHPSQWLVGPIAFGASVGSIGEPGGQPDLFMVAKTSDAAAAQADLASITGLFPPKTVTPVSIGGARFIEAPVGGAANASVTYGLVDDWLYLVSGDTQAVVDAASSGGLTQNPRFQALQAGLGQDPTNVFIDIQGTRELATGMLGVREREQYDSQFALLINPLTLFGGGVRSDGNGDIHGRFLLGISGA